MQTSMICVLTFLGVCVCLCIGAYIFEWFVPKKDKKEQLRVKFHDMLPVPAKKAALELAGARVRPRGAKASVRPAPHSTAAVTPKQLEAIKLEDVLRAAF